MKITYMNQRNLKLVASHALLVAIVTQPAFIGLFTDLYVFVTNKTPNSIGFLDGHIYASMQLLSSLALVTGAIALVLYFMTKNSKSS